VKFSSEEIEALLEAVAKTPLKTLTTHRLMKRLNTELAKRNVLDEMRARYDHTPQQKRRKEKDDQLGLGI
jgi:hypothetical protein